MVGRAALLALAVLTAPSVTSTLTSAQEPDRWDVAERSIRRLPVDSFPLLPDGVRDEMRRLDCFVPQGSDLVHPHNVVSGRFAAADQVDWAFLCSKDGASALHVFWGGPSGCPSPVGPADDRSFLEGLGGDEIGFSRRLMPIDRDRMARYAQGFDGPAVPEVGYQGLEDYFEGKASVVWLCVERAWIKLPGID